MTQQKQRVNAGFQCPECSGARVNAAVKQPHEQQKFECQECGCHWSDTYYSK